MSPAEQAHYHASTLASALRAIGGLAQADGALSASGYERQFDMLRAGDLCGLMEVLAQWTEAQFPEPAPGAD